MRMNIPMSDITGEEPKPAPEPKATRKKKAAPVPTTAVPDIPEAGSAENTIRLGDDLIEIKPTKLQYMRNRTAAFYRWIQMYPLVDILMRDTVFDGDERDGDQCVFDWLVAVLDNEEIVKKHYNDMDQDVIDRILAIFTRLNHFDVREERLKNLRADREEG